jgi:hypothetical protein
MKRKKKNKEHPDLPWEAAPDWQRERTKELMKKAILRHYGRTSDPDEAIAIRVFFGMTAVQS